MLSKLRSRLSYANVMATVAVFIALGGSSYAAIKLPANSVGTKQLKKNAVTLKKIKRSTRKALKGQKGDSGPRGATGATGQQGPTGPQGPAGSDGGFNGAAAGGDLTGTYPNPLVKANAIGGGEVQDNSLDGADVVESSLGKVPDADTLDGVDSSQYQRVGLVQAGAANQTDAEGHAFIITWDQLADIQTDGDADADNTLQILNTGSQTIEARYPNGISKVSPGQIALVNVGFSPTPMLIYSVDGVRSWLVTCGPDFGGAQIRCQGVANRLG